MASKHKKAEGTIRHKQLVRLKALRKQYGLGEFAPKRVKGQPADPRRKVKNPKGASSIGFDKWWNYGPIGAGGPGWYVGPASW